jgi:hypothetical protein
MVPETVLLFPQATRERERESAIAQVAKDVILFMGRNLIIFGVRVAGDTPNPGTTEFCTCVENEP